MTYTRMTPAEAIERLLLYHSTGDVKHRNAVIEGNKGMLIDLVNQPRFQFHNIDTADLLQEAIIGFTIGLDRYDPVKAQTGNGTAKPANYAFHYANGAVLAFIRLHGHNIPIPDNCHRAYKVMQQRTEEAIREYQTDNITPSCFLDDSFRPYQKDGALALFNRHYVDIDDIDVADSLHGYSRSDLTKVLHQLEILPEPQRSIVRAHFGIGDVTIADVRKSMGFAEDMIERIVHGCIRIIRRNIAEHRSDYLPPKPKERMFFAATQTVLFPVPRKGKQSAPATKKRAIYR